MPFITGTWRYIFFHNNKDIPSSFYYDWDKYITSGACAFSTWYKESYTLWAAPTDTGVGSLYGGKMGRVQFL